MYAYAFLPPVLLHLILKKVAQEHCTLILIAPYSAFMVPITPGTSHRSSKRTTSDTKNVDREKMLSGLSRSRKPKTCSLKNIQHKQAKRKFSQTAQRYMENQPKEFMMQDCEFLKAGVVSNVSVHILSLKKAIFLIYLQEVKGW